MEELKSADHSALIEMLAKLTNEYMRMLKSGATHEEFENCKDLIDRISIEIESRKKK